MRRRSSAAVGSALFFVLAPGLVGGAVPWGLTRWSVRSTHLGLIPVRIIGAVLVVVGVGVLVDSFVRFVVEGRGTPAPPAAPERLVISGPYRYVRNPMYLAVGAVIVGQALLLWQPVLLAYAVAFGFAVYGFVRVYEEPTMRRRFGAQYETYRRAVPGWLPRRPRA